MSEKPRSTKAKANKLYAKIRNIYPTAETLYEDVIIEIVGTIGLITLRENHMIETCAMFNGRKLYAL